MTGCASVFLMILFAFVIFSIVAELKTLAFVGFVFYILTVANFITNTIGVAQTEVKDKRKYTVN